MKIKIVNKQKINASVKNTLNAIIECEKWPLFIPTVEKVEFIEKDEFRAVRVLHSRINNILAKMVTETHYYPERNEIEYTQIKTPWPLSSNEGKWKVRKISENRVELMITHIIKVKYSFIGYIFGLLVIAPFFIYKHNRKDLKLYKNYLESNV